MVKFNASVIPRVIIPRALSLSYMMLQKRVTDRVRLLESKINDKFFMRKGGTDVMWDMGTLLGK